MFFFPSLSQTLYRNISVFVLPCLASVFPAVLFRLGLSCPVLAFPLSPFYHVYFWKLFCLPMTLFLSFSLELLLFRVSGTLSLFCCSSAFFLLSTVLYDVLSASSSYAWCNCTEYNKTWLSHPHSHPTSPSPPTPIPPTSTPDCNWWLALVPRVGHEPSKRAYCMYSPHKHQAHLHLIPPVEVEVHLYAYGTAIPLRYPTPTLVLTYAWPFQSLTPLVTSKIDAVVCISLFLQKSTFWVALSNTYAFIQHKLLRKVNKGTSAHVSADAKSVTVDRRLGVTDRNHSQNPTFTLSLPPFQSFLNLRRPHLIFLF